MCTLLGGVAFSIRHNATQGEQETSHPHLGAARSRRLRRYNIYIVEDWSREFLQPGGAAGVEEIGGLASLALRALEASADALFVAFAPQAVDEAGPPCQDDRGERDQDGAGAEPPGEGVDACHVGLLSADTGWHRRRLFGV